MRHGRGDYFHVYYRDKQALDRESIGLLLPRKRRSDLRASGSGPGRRNLAQPRRPFAGAGAPPYCRQQPWGAVEGACCQQALYPRAAGDGHLALPVLTIAEGQPAICLPALLLAVVWWGALFGGRY